jgi:opacity protein-like surface antigen
MTATRIFFALATAMAATPISATAGQGTIIDGVVAAAAIESRTEIAIAGGIGYRVNRFVGFGVEVTSMPVLKPDAATLRSATIIDSLGPAAVLNSAAGPTASASDGRAIVFTTNVRIELPPIATRFLPYVVGGGGIANIKDNFTVTLPVPVPGIPVVIQPQGVTQSSTNLALTAGGGASILMTGHVSVDVDVRYLRLIASRDLNVGRFGIGFSYRFGRGREAPSRF